MSGFGNYVDGRHGIAQLEAKQMADERDPYALREEVRALQERLSILQTHGRECDRNELARVQAERDRLRALFDATVAARDALADIAEQHWARRQVSQDMRDGALEIVSKLREVGR